MVEIEVLFSVNASKEDAKKLDINLGAINKFTRYGFTENYYDAKVSFYCPPRAVDPGIMEIIINAKDIAELLLFLGGICKGIHTFIKNHPGYKRSIDIKTPKTASHITPKQLEVDISEEELERLMREELETLNK